MSDLLKVSTCQEQQRGTRGQTQITPSRETPTCCRGNVPAKPHETPISVFKHALSSRGLLETGCVSSNLMHPISCFLTSLRENYLCLDPYLRDFPFPFGPHAPTPSAAWLVGAGSHCPQQPLTANIEGRACRRLFKQSENTRLLSESVRLDLFCHQIRVKAEGFV